MLKENIIHRFSVPLRLALLLWFFSALPAWCADLVFLWDANTEPDLEGYGIYFKDIPDSKYFLYGYVALHELADPASPKFVMSDLEKGKTYYFASLRPTTGTDWKAPFRIRSASRSAKPSSPAPALIRDQAVVAAGKLGG